MPSRQQINRRIKSVKNTRQITKAMQLVAASKMRKAQDAAAQTRLFSTTARELLTRLRQIIPIDNYPLYQQRPIKSRLSIVVTSDRGLAGAYDANVLKQYVGLIREDQAAGIVHRTICIGRKGSTLASRLQGVELIGAYHGFPEHPEARDLQPIVETLMDQFITEKVDAVTIIFTRFHSTVNQEAMRLGLLPAGFSETEIDEPLRLATFEPSEEVVLRQTTRRLLEVQLLQALLESFASEQSMRMMAMKSATDNANELVDDLTLAFNNARQAAITQELAEISGGVEALNE